MFQGRVVKEHLTRQQILSDYTCQHTWDYPGTLKIACSWTYPDPMNPGKKACHIRYTNYRDYETELLNCSTVDNVPH